MQRWRTTTDFVAFTEDEWDANPNSQVNTNYAAYVDSRKRNDNDRQMRFKTSMTRRTTIQLCAATKESLTPL